ncbi:MAG: MMPL family transporter, partial [Micrococcales bacterium]|nr:MMPL family transporter [Micrococcales bacterium]
VAGAGGQIVVVVPAGQRVDSGAARADVLSTVERLQGVPGIAAVTNPFSKDVSGVVSADHRAAIVSLQFDGEVHEIAASTKDAVRAQAQAMRERGLTAEVGGSAFGNAAPTLSWIEALGLVLALGVLLVFFRSVRAAGAPLIIAVLAAATTGLALIVATAVIALTGTAPMLALMLCTAVGIDYSLFLLSRYVENLGDGIEGSEAAARATATAGSAVVFAGFTVVTALSGLVIVGLPFLSAMGIAAAIGVTIAVAAAVTLGPALMSYLQTVLDPRNHRRHEGRPGWAARVLARLLPIRHGDHEAPTATSGHGRGRGWQSSWIEAVTRRPSLTVLLVTGALLATAVPAKDLRLALPDNGTAATSQSERRAYDLVAQFFGPGENAPLLIVADIVHTTDPVGVMNDLRTQIEATPGVLRVTLATPNRKADTGVVVAIPTTAAGDPATADLVQRLRDRAPQMGAKYDVTLRVAGQTAAQIDVSQRLQSALVPFGVVVIGLSLLLLLVVFRSLVVPLTAAIGFLLSVGAAFGIVAAVFEWGWLAGPLHVARIGPVISFMPVILMGVLFGLAMDYQMFIVSRMHEHFSHHRDASAAVRQGFVTSAGVVAAAAVIMVGVFAAFVPEGDASLKPIALGLAAGVFVDAFIVRMMLIPAVLQLFGHSAWALPGWLSRRLPHLDVEGHGVAHQIAAEETMAAHPDRVVHARELRVSGPRGEVFTDLSLDLRAGTLCALTGDEGGGKTAALLALAGRLGPSGGELDVAGAVIPEQSGIVQRRVGLGEFPAVNPLDGDLSVRQHIAERLAPRTLLPWARRGDVDAVIAHLDEACDIAARAMAVEQDAGSVAAGPVLDPAAATAVSAQTTQAGETADLDASREPATPPRQVRRAEPVFVDPATNVQDLSRLQRHILAIVLAGIGRPALIVVDDVDQLRTRQERVAVWAVLGWIARTGEHTAAVATCRDIPNPDDLSRWSGLPLDRVQVVALQSVAPVPALGR